MPEPVKRNNFVNITTEWLAGFFDGEGSVGAYGKWFTVNVSISQKNYELLAEIKKLFPEFSGPHANHGAGKKRETTYALHATGRKALRFLELILPHLVVKQKQAYLAIAVIKLGEGENYCLSNPLPDEDLAVRAVLAREIKLDKNA